MIDNIAGLALVATIATSAYRTNQLLRIIAFRLRAELTVCTVVALNVTAVSILSSLSLLNHFNLAVCTLIAANVGWSLLTFAYARSLQRAPGVEPRQRLVITPAAVGVAVVALLVLVQVLLYAPTGHDSMAYHFPKLAHLIDDGGVTPFASQYSHINETPWGYTYLAFIAWLAMGRGTFQYLGVLQLAGFVACLGLLARMTYGVNGERSRHVWRVLLGVLVVNSMILMQGPSGRNDLVASAFCLLTVSSVIAALRHRDDSSWVLSGCLLAAFGAAGVLALKPNLLLQSVLIVFFLVCVAAVAAVQRSGSPGPRARRTLHYRHLSISRLVVGSALLLLAAGLSAPFLQATASNIATYGKITGPASDAVVGGWPGPADATCRTAMTLAWESKVADPARNLMAAALQPISQLEQHVLEGVSHVCDDRRLAPANNITPGSDPFAQGGSDGYEDDQPSPLQLHLLVGSLATLALIGIRRLRRRRVDAARADGDLTHVSSRRPSDIAVLGASVAALLIGGAASPWQSFSNSRFLLPTWLLIDATIISIGLTALRAVWPPRRARRQWRAVGTVVAIALAAQCSWLVANNAKWPLPGSTSWGSVERGSDWSAYARVGIVAGKPAVPVEQIGFVIDAAAARRCTHIGVTDAYIWMFPLWLAGRDHGMTVSSVDVDNPTGRFERVSGREQACLFFGPLQDVPSSVDTESVLTVPYGWMAWA